MGMRKGLNIDEVLAIRKLSKINTGDKLLFKVMEVNKQYSVSKLIELPEIVGKVVYEEIGNFGINGTEWFDIGDVFEASVVRKDINRTLIIVPLWNLAEIKKSNTKQNKLERWKSGGK